MGYSSSVLFCRAIYRPHNNNNNNNNNNFCSLLYNMYVLDSPRFSIIRVSPSLITLTGTDHKWSGGELVEWCDFLRHKVCWCLLPGVIQHVIVALNKAHNEWITGYMTKKYFSAVSCLCAFNTACKTLFYPPRYRRAHPFFSSHSPYKLAT
jgi:hypothetical protein